MPSLYEQFSIKNPIREQIDRCFLEIFGYEKEKIDRILKFIYEVIANEIQNLRSIMGK